jgi:hypothetical protein
MNKYVVRLSPQELRHAKAEGRFHDFVEDLGELNFWREQKVFSPNTIKRMRSVEFAAELAILLIEGPQDKKASIDLYYGQYKDKFPQGSSVRSRLSDYLGWIERALPTFAKTRYRSPVDLYSFIGALHRITDSGSKLSTIRPASAGANLLEFEKRTRAKIPTGDAARYVTAASRQTDNLTPRSTRIEVIEKVLRS